MQRMKWWKLLWMVSFVFLDIFSQNCLSEAHYSDFCCFHIKEEHYCTTEYVNNRNICLTEGDHEEAMAEIMNLPEILEKLPLDETELITCGNFEAHLCKPEGNITGLGICEETSKPMYQYISLSPECFSQDGCLTLWKCGRSNITCSCDHFRCFSVHEVPSELTAQLREAIRSIEDAETTSETIKVLKNFEERLEETEVNGTKSLYFENVVALLHKPSGTFKGLTIYASETQAAVNAFPSSTVNVHLPSELDIGPNNKIVFSMFKLPQQNKSISGSSYELYDRRLVSLSVQGNQTSGLQESVKVTMTLTEEVLETHEPICHFLNFSTKNFSQDGCLTLWTCGQSNITCSCDHFGYFGVLMVPSELNAGLRKVICFIKDAENILETIRALESLEDILNKKEVNGTESLYFENVVALLHKPNGTFSGLQIYASETQAGVNSFPNSTVTVHLPSDLDDGLVDKIVFAMIKLPGTTKETHEPICHFLNFSTKNFSQDGCLTLWTCGQSTITCSCDHFGYFGVLMVPSKVNAGLRKVICFIKDAKNILETIRALESLEDILNKEEFNRTESLYFENVVALLHKPNGTFSGLQIYANETQAAVHEVSNSTVTVHLPSELDAGPIDRIVFAMVKLPGTSKSISESSYELYERRLVGLSVQGNQTSGLQESVNITMNLAEEILETHEPICHFLNFSTKNFSQDGCLTLWTCGQSTITCSCDHFGYFGVLMVPSKVNAGLRKVICFIKDAKNILETIRALESLEDILNKEEFNRTESLYFENVVALLHKPNGTFSGLQIYANETQAAVHEVSNSTVTVHLPSELDAGPIDKIVFAMVKLPGTSKNTSGSSHELYERRLVGLSVQGKNISGLQERVNITMDLTKDVNETKELSCQFLNFSTNNFSEYGCLTLWTRGQSHITCSCDHFGYFGVLLMFCVTRVPPRDTASSTNLCVGSLVQAQVLDATLSLRKVLHQEGRRRITYADSTVVTPWVITRKQPKVPRGKNGGQTEKNGIQTEKNAGQTEKNGEIRKNISSIEDAKITSETFEALKKLDERLKETEVNGTKSLHFENAVALLHKPSDTFKGLTIYASETQAAVEAFPSSTVIVHLPSELDTGPNNKIVFSMVELPEKNKNMFGSSHELYECRLVGLSVQGKNITGLQEHVNITMELTKHVTETQEFSCQFLNFSTNSFSQYGCLTLWTRGQSNITCSCDHFGYFGVLMAPREKNAEQSEKNADHMKAISSIEDAKTTLETFAALKNLEERLEETEVNETTSFRYKNVVALLHKPSGTFRGLTIYASDTQASVNAFPSTTVIVHLPSELDTGPNNKIVFFMVELPEKNKNMFGSSHELYERRLFGLSVQGKNISGLQERVNITMKLTKDKAQTQELSCQFLNFSTNSFSEYGCLTLWTPSQINITCSCDHLTYFGVLLVPSELGKAISSIEAAENTSETIKALKNLEESLEEKEVNGTKFLYFKKKTVALLHKPSGTFRGLTIYASDTQAAVEVFPSSTVIVHLPSELDTGPNNKIMFSMVELPEKNKNTFGSSHELYERRLVSLSVQGKNIAGLQERVNITMNLTKDITETKELSCQFLNFSTNSFSNYGCITLWTPGQSNIICSCDHLTYFFVLMEPSELNAELRKNISSIEDAKTPSDFFEALKNLEERLEETEVNETKWLHYKNVVALLHKPNGTFRGLTIYASDTQAAVQAFPSTTVIVHLPSELDTGPNNKIVFSMVELPEKNKNIFGSSHELYERRLVGLSVQGKNISGLQERVNITMNLTKDVTETQNLSCQFLNFSTNNFSEYGCLTLWTPGQSHITCSCDHLTYFGVLMVPAELGKAINSIEDAGTASEFFNALKKLEGRLKETEVNDTTSFHYRNVVVLLHKPNGSFGGLAISANETQAALEAFPSITMTLDLPSKLEISPNNTIVFSMVKLPEKIKNIFGSSHELYERRLVGLSVKGKNISGLQERVNITMNLTKNVTETQNLSCQFLNFSTNNFSEYGCLTLWTHGQSHITCSCDHLTYFGVLMVTVPISEKDREILTYITLIGCSFSLLSLVITVLLFITNRKLRQDVSMKVHINLVIALILLNIHFLPNQAVAALSSTGLCFYMALLLHYSLLATFSWMALEGFHLYLLLIKVFNIYIKRYLLKLSLVGWGVPAVIVSVVMSIDTNFYGLDPLDMSNSSDTKICYITNGMVKMGTTVGLFSLVFLFNVIMFGAILRRVLILRRTKEFGHSDSNRTKKDVCTLLGVITLFGITWGLIFFSFGYLTTPGLYLFCILNPLQGFFIFLWFVMSLRKAKKSAIMRVSETRNTST